jgi:hypothetical protein
VNTGVAASAGDASHSPAVTHSTAPTRHAQTLRTATPIPIPGASRQPCCRGGQTTSGAGRPCVTFECERAHKGA